MPPDPVQHDDGREERRDHVVDVVVAERVAGDEERHGGERGAGRRDAAYGQRARDRDEEEPDPRLALGVGRHEQKQLAERLDEEGAGEQQIGPAGIHGAEAGEHGAEHRTAGTRADRPPG
jgi:hypothetical protein